LFTNRAPFATVRFDTQVQGQCCQKRAFLAQNALKQLQEVVRLGGNVLEELLETVKVASLGQTTDALFNVGGQYRRNMWDHQILYFEQIRRCKEIRRDVL